GIRDLIVTGVQTCALPICGLRRVSWNCIRKNKDCVLQRLEPTERLSGATLRFSGLYVSTPTIDESRWKAVRQFLSCGQRQGGQGDARRRASLESCTIATISTWRKSPNGHGLFLLAGSTITGVFI